MVKNLPTHTEYARDASSVPGSGRPPGEGNGNPLQYSCLENPMDGGVWWATVHGVAKSWTRMSDFTLLHFNVLMVFKAVAIEEIKQGECRERRGLGTSLFFVQVSFLLLVTLHTLFWYLLKQFVPPQTGSVLGVGAMSCFCTGHALYAA